MGEGIEGERQGQGQWERGKREGDRERVRGLKGQGEEKLEERGVIH